MKKFFAAVLVILLSVSAFAVITGGLFGPGSFKVDIIKKKHMKTVAKKDLPSELKIDYAFTNARKTYQLWYSMFKQNDKNAANDDLMLNYGMYAFAYLMNMSAADLNPDAIQRFDDSDVKIDFNGDFGATALIEYPKKEYSREFKYMLVNFYCKKGQGLVVQTILFSDVNIVTDNEFIEAFNSFRFKD